MEERLVGTENEGFEIPCVPEQQPQEAVTNHVLAVVENRHWEVSKVCNEPRSSHVKSLRFDRYGFVIGEESSACDKKTISDEGQTTTTEDVTTVNNSEQQHRLESDKNTSIKIDSSEKNKVMFSFWRVPNLAIPRTDINVSVENAPLHHRPLEESLSIQKRRGADIPEPEALRRLSLETLREQKWQRMLQNWGRHHNSKTKTNTTKLKRRIRKGIPNNLRGRAWSMLTDVPNKMEENTKRYEQLVWSKEIPSQDTRDVIERDIHRTFPRHALFIEERNSSLSAGSSSDKEITSLAERLLQVDHYANQVFSCGIRVNSADDDDENANISNDLLLAKGGQASLRRVLRAYSLYDADVGYCQGMNFIAATLITFMEEEEAFWMLVVVMNEQPTNMRGLFGEGMQQTQQILDTSEKLIKEFFPVLYKHFEKENIHITMFVTQWMLTVFTSSFPFDLVVRVWDCFVAEGYKIVYRVMLALLKISMPDLLQLPFEEILAYLQRLPSKIDGHQVMETAFSINLKRKQILKYERQYYKELGNSSRN